MIRINRPDEPQILTQNKDAWTARLIEKIEEYKGYENIPDDEKKLVLSPYRHVDIKSSLFLSSNKKCAFCECIPEEGGGYLQVEHFHPKSIYPHECFEWMNLLPCCNICNVNKGVLNTKVSFIINPYDADPEKHFYCNFLKILPNHNDVAAAITEREIEINSARLINSRTELLRKLQLLTEELRDLIELLDEADTDRKSVRRKNMLIEKYNEINEYVSPKSIHSFFCTSVILQDKHYLAAKAIL
ncbi:hypothetical protein OK409_01080 [Pantoea sp. RG18]|uniref:hypothetical protein n=1 Tax=Pantoea sp. RG18 TaxID=2981603 RepID=UPI00222044AB|nr:hypothetical protein [Pantoea sp. RG18]MCW0935327.1 hypothetical protein [Pantoea sp. RG18]